MKDLIKTGALLLSMASTAAYGASYCGELNNAYGPFDYRKTEFSPNLHLVEIAHFTPDVEKLIKGQSGTLGGDLDYTLRAFPNHHRALASLARYALRSKTTRVPGLKYSFECYFNRAVRFRPDDSAVRMMYGVYLSKLGRTDDALAQLIEAVNLEPENGPINYNLGLVYFEKKDYANARLYAEKAASLDFPLQGLKTKLAEAGKWPGQDSK